MLLPSPSPHPAPGWADPIKLAEVFELPGLLGRPPEAPVCTLAGQMSLGIW